MFLSLPTLTVLIPLVSLAGPLVSLAGLFYSAWGKKTCRRAASTASLCSYSLFLPVTIPVYVFFLLWTWMGIKLFWHN
ncbi:phosphatidylinositol N-acetylglucosaminyltransferase subunit Y-like [Tupaia chinensis]|uniref:phosphatidylinositol N-acetylglucosaminyltransferase subunit Y-like n=1 Tax=Tupaia chinensis TaxID=246437 RepID=UPI0003C91243|nr:phosphatidylinositol N-acetylglucosaminyltransferase subunit Y-like [Tupaia chinensis]